MSEKNIVLLRRRGLGNTSCKGIRDFSKSNVQIVRNDQKIPQNTNIVVRWGCTSEIGHSGITLNKSKSIHEVNNKKTSRKKMIEGGVNVPKNVDINGEVNFPIIIRPTRHSQGRRLFLCNNQGDIRRALNNPTIQKIGYYACEYIKKDRELGVFIFNNRVTSVIEKVPKREEDRNAIAWNVAQGTHSFQNVNWDNWHIPSCIEALKAIKLFELDFGRVDIIIKDNVAYVLEINSAHSLTSEYRQEVFAKCIDWVSDNGFVQNEIDFDKVKTYKSIIHPCLRVNNNNTNL